MRQKIKIPSQRFTIILAANLNFDGKKMIFVKLNIIHQTQQLS